MPKGILRQQPVPRRIFQSKGDIMKPFHLL